MCNLWRENAQVHRHQFTHRNNIICGTLHILKLDTHKEINMQLFYVFTNEIRLYRCVELYENVFADTKIPTYILQTPIHMCVYHLPLLSDPPFLSPPRNAIRLSTPISKLTLHLPTHPAFPTLPPQPSHLHQSPVYLPPAPPGVLHNRSRHCESRRGGGESPHWPYTEERMGGWGDCTYGASLCTIDTQTYV